MNAQDSLIGTTLKGKWRLDARIGRGGMATVYAATHRNGKRVAVKVLHPELSRDSAVRERFVREGYLANRVGRGAVSVDDDDVTDEGSAFLVMELLEGETLDHLRERSAGGRLAAAEVVAVTDQVLATLAVAHEQGIVHRDIKPENIFLTSSGVVKLLDFGIARLREGGASEKSATVTGTLMGTPSYLPPEQARGRWDEVDGRSDLWAVGATMFELLSARCVRESGTVPELLLQAMTQPAPPLLSVAPDVPADLAAIVDRALAHGKEERWADASTMRDALLAIELPTAPSVPVVSVAEAAHEHQERQLRQPTVVTMSSRTLAPVPTARSRRSAAVAAVVVVAGIPLAAWFAWPSSMVRTATTPAAAAEPAATQAAPNASPPTAMVVTPAVTGATIAVSELPDVAPSRPPKPSASTIATPKTTTAATPKPKPIPADPFSARR
jgi:serine/threonine-protein kinase